MQTTPITTSDLPLLHPLQPPDWPDIIPAFQAYIKQSFTHPFKFQTGNDIIGIGTAIVFPATAWLAHIIVHPKHRNKGIGYAIVKYLVDFIRRFKAESILLIATDLGKPVYKKIGFETVEQYKAFICKAGANFVANVEGVVNYQPEFLKGVLKIDVDITGEQRKQLIEQNLINAKVYRKNGHIEGAYLPQLGEGLIIANNPEAGMALMNEKMAVSNKFVLPESNCGAILHLYRNGYNEVQYNISRMVLDKPLLWKPQNVFSRVGGNYG